MTISMCVQGITSMTEENLTSVPEEHFLVFKEQRYLSYYDEKFFYAWLDSIEGVENVTGVEAGNLRVELGHVHLSRSGAFDLIALFTRYGYPLSPIRDHIAPKDVDYFKRPDARWYDELFGRDADSPRAQSTTDASVTDLDSD